MSPSQASKKMTHLADLLSGLAISGNLPDCEVTGISVDSRDVKPGYLFIGMPGVNADGRDFANSAIENGAVALLLEAGEGDQIPATTAPAITMRNIRSSLGLILNRFYGYPSTRLKMIGVTGTNGKTTCTQLLGRILDEPDRRCAIIGTLGNGFPGELETGIHTTPDVVTVYRLLANYVEQGAYAVCMEVSSHALEQERVAGIHFNVAVFTNLTRDHLDYHGDMESYAAAKARLFEVEGLEFAVINQDDEFGQRLSRGLGNVKLIGFGFNQGDIRAENLQATLDGTSLSLVLDGKHYDLHCNMYGDFNVSNLLAVSGALKALDWPDDDIVAALTKVTPVPGRMEQFGNAEGGPVIVIDYAHTPDALKHALQALRPHARGELWCVFGCGGNRDRGKRSLMGQVADELADHVVLTDDNPRTESPDQIISEIEQGMRRDHQVIRPRERAVRETITNAHMSDLILLAGKGHEDYQELGTQRVPYSDRLLVQEILEEVA